MKKYTIENIDRYIHNEMAPSEKKQWDIKRKTDVQLDKEINLHIDIENSLKEKDIILLRKKISKIIRNNYSPNENDIYKLKEPSQITTIAGIILTKHINKK